MKLHWSPRSPFVRKVMIVLHETGQLPEVELVPNTVALHLPPDPEVLAANPLGKIPALVTEGGTVLFDSRVICEYLDLRSGTGLFPAQTEARIDQLRWQALGDGLTDILLLWRTELTREAGPWTAVTDGWRAKVRAAMARLEAEADALAAGPSGIGQVAVICALGQLDFRWPDCAWRAHFPQLARAEAVWAAWESVKATAVAGDGAGPDAVTAGQLTFGP
ncbi:glutathione S-transferase N-terminal domain-containing protein [Psychromarinibacter sp. C21-152]|uniref:Glutathione S-transferase N-terminal domain-containing protein n=1 Tax=Psychromarinibacter sediminicola TaxID=3033385 RepID=A0AAE3T9W3_9RHOB|nr:glutathione S-transferase N-terminal domain-containing protein [Psychromarinibacter sediminicola]MDF0601374.1 glutathione S-transferase N-terminal domain-containing protein [Psychromarinibacter sediminicola]